MTTCCFSYLTMCIHPGNSNGLHFSERLGESVCHLFRSKGATGRGEVSGLTPESPSYSIKGLVTDLFAALNALEC